MNEFGKSSYFVEITEDATGKVIQRMGPHAKRTAEKIADGVEINLNHERYSVRVVPAVPEEVGAT